MAYTVSTGGLSIRTPNDDEDLDIPYDLKQMAADIETGVTSRINNNIVNSVTLTVGDPSPPAGGAVVVGEELRLYVNTPEVDDRVSLATGGTLDTGSTTIFDGVVRATRAPVDAKDVVNKEYLEAQASAFVGEIRMFAHNFTGAGWYPCNGSVHGSSALLAEIGSNTTPNLLNRFPFGWDGSSTTRTTGGASSHALSVAQMPSHNHSASSQSANHYHSYDSSYHNQTITPTGSIAASSTNHTHSGNTSTVSAWHTHTFRTGGQSASHSHGGYQKFATTTGIARLASGGGYTSVDGWVDNTDGASNDHNHTGTTDNPSANHHHSFTTGYQNQTSTHSHSFTGNGVSIDHRHSGNTANNSASHSHTIGSAGNGQSFSLMPPWMTLKFMIYGGN